MNTCHHLNFLYIHLQCNNYCLSQTYIVLHVHVLTDCTSFPYHVPIHSTVDILYTCTQKAQAQTRFSWPCSLGLSSVHPFLPHSLPLPLFRLLIKSVPFDIHVHVHVLAYVHVYNVYTCTSIIITGSYC